MGLLTTWNLVDNIILVIGTSALASKRKATVEKHGAKAIVMESATTSDLTSIGRDEVNNVVDGVFIIISSEEDLVRAQELYQACVKLRIPVNVADHPEMCTFSLPSIYEDGPFQLGISTGGTGCRLANRIKRVVVNALPSNMGQICTNIGGLRQQITQQEESSGDDDDAEQPVVFNKLVLENHPKTGLHKRQRWLAQIVEYFPLSRLSTVTLDDLTDLTDLGGHASPEPVSSPAKGSISLVGAGPGSAGLLTTEALREITAADYILADKLVPEEVLALIPKQTPVFIARKFPGNAERAQEELLEKGLVALQEGKRVVRLKQGDPYIYGRGAEEYLHFSSHGFTPKVVAGVTSALAAPLLAKIAPTHRGYADQILICTGTGRAGALPTAPEWVSTRTTIFLMALHRIREVADMLVAAGWDADVPCAAVERASCPDQRVVRSKLCHIAEALEAVGSRPPGLLVVGRACEVLVKSQERWTVEEGTD